MSSLVNWKSAQSGLAVRLRGTSQQTVNGLLHVNSLVSGGKGSDTSPFDSRRVQGYQLNYMRYQSANAANGCSIGVRIPNWLWGAGLYVASGTTFTDDTTDWQDTGTGDFALSSTSTNDDGFIVYSPVKFNLITINVGTASSGTSQTAAITFSSGAGTWSAMPTASMLAAFTGAATFYPIGENIIYFKEPALWGKTTGAEAVGLPSGMYAVKVAATTAATTSGGLGNSAEVWRMYLPSQIKNDGTGLLADGAIIELPGQLGAIAMPYGDALGVYSTVSTNSNYVTASFQSGGAFAGGDN